MATPFVVLTKFQQYPPCRKSMQILTQAVGFLTVSTRRRHSKSIGHSKEGTRGGSIARSEHGRPYSHDCVKARRRKRHFQVPEIPRPGFWYVKSSRAFYNELSCDNYNDPTALGELVVGVDPYFSVPVMYPPNAALMV